MKCSVFVAGFLALSRATVGAQAAADVSRNLSMAANANHMKEKTFVSEISSTALKRKQARKQARIAERKRARIAARRAARRAARIAARRNGDDDDRNVPAAPTTAVWTPAIGQT